MKKLIAVVLTLSFGTLACSGKASLRACEKRNECMGLAKASCTEEQKAYETLYGQKCSAQNEALASCQLEKATCDNGVYAAPNDGCKTELDAYTKCFSTGS